MSAAVRLRFENVRKIREIFKKFDSDNDGYIDHTELMALVDDPELNAIRFTVETEEKEEERKQLAGFRPQRSHAEKLSYVEGIFSFNALDQSHHRPHEISVDVLIRWLESEHEKGTSTKKATTQASRRSVADTPADALTRMSNLTNFTDSRATSEGLTQISGGQTGLLGRIQNWGNTETYFCPICIENKEKDGNMKALLPCNHPFCKTCVAEYVAHCVNERNVKPICPADKCRNHITEEEVVSLLTFHDSSLVGKYNRFKAEAENPELRTCSKCQNGDSGKASAPAMTCSTCGHIYCFTHGDSHQGLTCEEHLIKNKEEDKKTQMAMDKYAKPCPKCKAPISRNGGCHHMTCASCKAHFCWLCLEVLEADKAYEHYSLNAQNLGRGCAGKLFAADQRGPLHGSLTGCKMLWFYIALGFFILALGATAGPLAIAFTVAFILMNWWIFLLSSECSLKYCCNQLWAMFLVFGVIFVVCVGVPLLPLGCLTFCVMGCCNCWEDLQRNPNDPDFQDQNDVVRGEEEDLEGGLMRDEPAEPIRS